MLTDICTIYWRNWTAFRRGFWRQFPILIVLAFVSGLIVPWFLLLGKGTGINSVSCYVDLEIFFCCSMFAGMISASSYQMERQQWTMQVLLASPVRPQGIFIGKWLWMMTATMSLAVLATVLCRVIHWTLQGSAWLNSEEIIFTTVSMVLTSTVCCWVIAGNSIASLVIRSMKSSQLVGSILGLLPLIMLLIAFQINGFKVSVFGMVVVSLVSISLTMLTLLFSYLAFRYEMVRV